jgi:hypothetical protein
MIDSRVYTGPGHLSPQVLNEVTNSGTGQTVPESVRIIGPDNSGVRDAVYVK